MSMALVGISYPWIETTELSKQILQFVLVKSEVVDMTSVFKRKTEIETDFASTIEFVLSVSTQLSALEYANWLEEVVGKIPCRRADSKVKLSLLLYENAVMMTPGLTLPHPDLQYDSLILRLSSEIWGHYEHPILKRNLRELANQRGEEINVEFIMQGQNLFD